MSAAVTWDDAVALLEPVHEALEALDANDATQAIASELREGLTRLARVSAPTTELLPSLSRTSQLVMTLVVAGLWPVEHLSALRPAFSQCAGAGYDSNWCNLPLPAASAWTTFRAAHRRPRVNILPAFCEEEPAAEIPAATPAPEGVEVDYSLVSVRTVSELGKDAAEQCLDDLTMRGHHRVERPNSESDGEEQHILTLGDAFCVVGQSAPEHLEAWWTEQGTRDPYQAFAVTYALSVCAGTQQFERLGRCVEQLDPLDWEAARCVADALHVVERPDRKALVEHWLRSPHPVQRATALELGTRRLETQPWLEAPACCLWLTDPNPTVARASLRGLARASSLPEGIVPQLHQMMLGSLGPDVALEAGRCLALCGSRAPYVALRQDGRALEAWGERALEVLVWFGAAEDAGILAQILKRNPQTAYSLDAVARFGFVETYAYLLHALSQQELEEDAIAALTTLLGPLPEDEDALQPNAWKNHLKRQQVKPGARYRLGKPWEDRKSVV
ncbi:MAG: hypothetical protein AB7S68_33580, partial [Polyangiaceae bacterium]